MARLPFDVVVNDDGSAVIKRFATNVGRSMKRVGDAGVRGSRRLKDSFSRIRTAAGGVRGSFQNMFRVATTLKSLFVAGIGTAILIKSFNALTSAASQQEDAINRLNAALRVNGEFSEEISQDLQDFASQLQKTTLFGDETTLAMLALAQSFGFSAEQSKVAVEAATELSVAAGIALEEAVRRVGRTISGSVADVSKFAKGIKDLTKEELAAGKAANELVKSLAGNAAAQIRTFSGRTVQLKNNVGDLSEVFGDTIIKSDDLKDSITDTSLAFSVAGDAIKKLEFTGLGDGIAAFIPTGELLTASIFFMSRAFVGLGILAQGATFNFRFLSDVVGLTDGAFRRGITSMQGMQKAMLELDVAQLDAEQSLRLLRVEASRARKGVKDLVDPTKELAESLKGLGRPVVILTEEIVGVFTQFDKEIEKSKKEFTGIIDIEKELNEAINKSLEDGKKLELQVNELRRLVGEAPLPVVEGLLNLPFIEQENRRLLDLNEIQLEESLAREQEIRRAFKIEKEIDFQKEADDEIERRSKIRGIILEGEALFLNEIREFENKQTAIKNKNSADRLNIAAKFLAAGNTLAQTFGGKNVEIQKGIASAQAAISTAVAVMNALASGGIAGPNFALAAAVAAMGAAQIAAIAAAKTGAAPTPPGPGGDTGGDFGGGVEGLREIPIEAVAPSGPSVIINISGFVGNDSELATELGRVFREAIGDDVDFGLETNIR